MGQPLNPDPRALRHALGMFGTGVTIVTARDPAGALVGVTASSFNSVSLDPPLVLWSVARSAWSCQAFTQARHWNVHVLSVDQEALSNRFARQGADKFAGLELEDGMTEAPLLRGCSARFQCRTQFAYDGGDHVILVGEVLGFDRSHHAPLLFVKGGYAIANPRAPDVSTAAEAAVEEELFNENLLGFLLGRAHLLYMNAFRPTFAQHGLSDADFYILSLMSLRQPISQVELAEHLGFTGVDTGGGCLRQLEGRRLVAKDGQGLYTLSGDGLRVIVEALAACKAVQEDLVDRVGAVEVASLRNLLKRVILATDPGLPKVWGQGPQGRPGS
ncbi:MAG: flavin reductase [Proteobacteria bacterium]|nr:flavin reductase [Pseudomonadota bacterium]